jgi:hypothetical protein
MSAYQTAPDAVTLHPSGWAKLPSGVWVNKLPPIDTRHPDLFAILSYDAANAFAKAQGVQLIRPETVVELNRHGCRLTPVILPDAALRTETPRRAGESSKAWDERLRGEMMSLAWARHHAAGIWAQLRQIEWNELLPVANAGKAWVAGASATHARLFGWSKSATSSKLGPHGDDDWWQPLQNAHARNYADYSSLAMFESPTEPGTVAAGASAVLAANADVIPPTPPIFPESAVVKGLSKLGTREKAGHNDGPEIERFFEGATRLVNGVETRTGWAPGWEWCGAFYGWCGGPGWRIAVREYVTDAIRAGTWRALGSGYRPCRGDGVVFARGGQDPTHGGLGHIGRVVTPPDASGVFETVEGNSGNAVSVCKRSLGDPGLRGFIDNNPE